MLDFSQVCEAELGISEADKRQAISEALRLTKPGRILIVAYCITDRPMINYTIRLRRKGDYRPR